MEEARAQIDRLEALEVTFSARLDQLEHPAVVEGQAVAPQPLTAPAAINILTEISSQNPASQVEFAVQCLINEAGGNQPNSAYNTRRLVRVLHLGGLVAVEKALDQTIRSGSGSTALQCLRLLNCLGRDNSSGPKNKYGYSNEV